MVENRTNPAWHEYDWFETATLTEVQNCLRAGADVNSYPSTSLSPLENAIGDTPDPKIIRILLDAGARIPGYALYLAIRRDGHEREILQMLIKAGADVNATDPDEKGAIPPPLQIAVGEGKTELVAMLMEAGADPFVEDFSRAETAFDWSRRKPEVLQAMIDNDLDVNALDHNHNTPLHNAVYHAEPGVITTLYEARADPGARNGHGETALDIALFEKNRKSLAELIGCLRANPLQNARW